MALITTSSQFKTSLDKSQKEFPWSIEDKVGYTSRNSAVKV